MNIFKEFFLLILKKELPTDDEIKYFWKNFKLNILNKYSSNDEKFNSLIQQSFQKYLGKTNKSIFNKSNQKLTFNNTYIQQIEKLMNIHIKDLIKILDNIYSKLNNKSKKYKKSKKKSKTKKLSRKKLSNDEKKSLQLIQTFTGFKKIILFIHKKLYLYFNQNKISLKNRQKYIFNLPIWKFITHGKKL